MTSLAAAADGQGVVQVGELLLAFGLSAVVGLERQLRGKSAGLRTQTIVGTAAALILLVGKYGFTDVLAHDAVVLDPSRVAAQIVSGVGFLGAGLIITRRGAIRGLTTAAAVWETAAIGMAAGAGLWLLALVVTALHFVIVLGFTPLGRWIERRGHAEREFLVTYEDGRGVLRDLLQICTARRWVVNSLTLTGTSSDGDTSSGHVEAPRGSDARPRVTVALTVSGAGVADGVGNFADVPGVVRVDGNADADE